MFNRPSKPYREKRINLNPAVAFAQDAKTFGETACPEFLSITRKAIAGRRTHCAVIPAKAGIHAKKSAATVYVYHGSLRPVSRWISNLESTRSAGGDPCQTYAMTAFFLGVHSRIRGNACPVSSQGAGHLTGDAQKLRACCFPECFCILAKGKFQI
jgi:hypothetical protein